MKLKIVSSVMIASMVASMLLISMVNTGSAEYLLGANAAFYVKLTNGIPPGQPTWWNATGSLVPGQKFNITCGIQNVVDMAGYGFTLTWNATYMNMTRWWLSPYFVAERNAGNWSAALLEFWTNDLRERPGLNLLPPRIGMFCGLGQTALGAFDKTGSFDICTIEFQINLFGPHGFYIWKDPANYNPWPYAGGQPYLQNEGAFPVPFHQTYSGWVNSVGKQNYDVVWCVHPLFAPPVPLSGKVANCMLWINPPPPFPPTATESYTPPFPLTGQNVAVTVTQTSPGFNGAALCPITSVTIDYGDGNINASVPFTPPSIVFNHAYSVAGPYLIKEYCYAAGMAGLGGLAWANISSAITILAPQLTGIDVYEVRHALWPGDPAGQSGNGAGIPGRPYDPQALVQLEAYIQYNGEPVQCKIVSFEVLVPSHGNQCMLYRTCYTNASGYADIVFRIPTICWPAGPESLFGKWWVYVDVSMCEVKYSDFMFFDMGYILTSSNMKVVTPTVKKCQLVNVTVDISNIDWASAGMVPATLILVVYDNNEVPIGQEIVTQSFAGETTFCQPVTTTVSMQLHIPKWTYVGASVAYINVFSNIPSLCGLAYCPEVSVGFLVLKT
jgi:hypothetical protein